MIALTAILLASCLLACSFLWKVLQFCNIVFKCWRNGIPVVWPTPASYRERSIWEKEQHSKLAYCLEYHKRHGSVVLSKVWPLPRVYVSEPEIVKQIMVLSSERFPKTDLARLAFYRVMGPSSLLLLDGAEHKIHRRLLNPAFSLHILQTMVPEMGRVARENMAEWGLSDRNPSLVVAAAKRVQHLTLLMLFRTMFGMEAEGDKSSITGEVGKGEACSMHLLQPELTALVKSLMVEEISLSRILLRRAAGKGSWKDLLPLPSSISSRRKLKRLDQLCMQMLDKNRGNKSSPLGLLLGGEEEGEAGEDTTKLSDTAIRDQAITFILAGHETTANMLSWTLLLLAENPVWQAEVRAQIWEICGRCNNQGGAEDMSFDKVNCLNLVTMTLYESLRLCPPVPITSRFVSADTPFIVEGKKMTVPKGALAVVDIMSMHKDPRFWPHEPEAFKPRRWESRLRGGIFAGPRLTEGQHPFSFLPFNAGQRGCIGSNFALLEGHVALACILQASTAHLPEEYDLE
ncbi:unnamed protein product [Choristocarpus tenellus]